MAPPLSTRYTRYCEVCGKSRKFYQYDINRGKGLYCCRQCAQRGRKMHQYHTYIRICTVCLLPFKTSVHTMYQCCVEHEYVASGLATFDPDKIISHPKCKRKRTRYQNRVAKDLNIVKPWLKKDDD